MTSQDYSQTFKILTSINQTHLLKYWDRLSTQQKEAFVKQIQNLNLPTLQQQQKLIDENSEMSLPLEPFTNYAFAGNEQDRMAGKDLIRQGLVGCLIVAGGQGSRLKIDGPKGICEISAIKHKTLFQIFAEKIKAAGKQNGRLLPAAIMTSTLNHDATLEYFEKNKFFGLHPEQITFFSQGSLPFLNSTGELFLENAYTLAEGPDGNGGALHHFYQQGIWKKWYEKGVRYLNFILIDNPLADPFDAELFGYQHRSQSEVVIKCTMRSDPHEKVGVLATSEHKTVVVEYTELPEDKRTALLTDGTLAYACANLSLFCFSLDFIKGIAEQTPFMPLHKNFKAVKFLDSNGNTVQADTPIAWKFEKFIFDVLPLANKVGALAYSRQECFAPLKNFEGKDSFTTVREALQMNDRKIFEDITQKKCTLHPFEISQEFYYPTPELLQKWVGKDAPSNYVEA